MRKPYPSDLTEEQRAIVEPLIPVPAVGRPRTNDMREVLNAIFYLNRAGCQWDMLPHGLPPKSTVYRHFARRRDDGTRERITDALRQRVRVAAGREPAPSAAVVDSQTVKGTEVGGARGHDGGKKLRGVKRHIVVDTPGLLLVVVVSAASADDGTFAPAALGRLTAEPRSRLGLIWADGKYHNHHLGRWLARSGSGYRIEVVSRPAGSKGFVLLHRRWVVERTFAWLGRYRRHSRDDEWHARSSESMIRISAIHRMLRLLKPDQSKESVPFKYRESQGKIAG
jgi:putative transposase